MGVEWVLVDEGLSRNGSFVNGERVEGRRLLDDGDELRFGRTLLRYRAPFQVSEQTRAATAPDLGPPAEPDVAEPRPDAAIVGVGALGARVRGGGG